MIVNLINDYISLIIYGTNNEKVNNVKKPIKTVDKKTERTELTRKI